MRIRDLIQQWHQKPPTEQELRAQLPAPDTNSLAALRDFIQFAEMKQVLDHVLLLRNHRKLSTVAIVSEAPREGKTFFAAALALAWGEMVGKKVLLVDTSTFTGPWSLELLSILECDEAKATRGQPVRTLSKNVHVLQLKDWKNDEGAGFAEYQLDRFIQAQKEQFDLVIFDTCALSATNRNNFDPVSISRRCDGALLVISQREARGGGMVTLKDRMDRERLPVLGVVKNSGAHQ